MNCTQVDVLLPEMAGGELAGERAARVREHVERCPACAERLAELHGHRVQMALHNLLRFLRLLPLIGKDDRLQQGVVDRRGVAQRHIVEQQGEREEQKQQTEASERFQVPLSTLNQKIKRLGIETRRRAFTARGPGYPEEGAEFSAGK